VDSEGDIKAFKDFKDEGASSGEAKESKKSTETEKESGSDKGSGKEQVSKGKQGEPNGADGKGGKILSKGYEKEHEYTDSFKGIPKDKEDKKGASKDTSVLATAQGGGDGSTKSSKGYGGGEHHTDNFKGQPRKNVMSKMFYMYMK
jgi:hypothetical protein